MAKEGAGKQPPWQTVILSFYKGFSTALSAAIGDFVKTHSADASLVSNVLFFWKSLGDELLYTAVIENPRQAGALVAVWLKAVQAFGITLRESDNKGLDLKSTAWLAGFPLKNREVIFQSSSGQSADKVELDNDADASVEQYALLNEWYRESGGRKSDMQLDFLGTSIDTGFRLTGFSTPEKMCISIELALILCMSLVTGWGTEIKVQYDGNEVLKGVLGGREYPILWISVYTHNDVAMLEKRLLGARDHDLNPQAIVAYCRAFIASKDLFLISPFIYKCGTPDFEAIEPWYIDWLISRKSYLEKETEKARLKTEQSASDVESPSVATDAVAEQGAKETVERSTGEAASYFGKLGTRA
ncbi:hypothetical protein [Asticcacaulis biprosthecium]|uniref:hypothetical protein n=1 Tax=Asticcacaulis biprosthecium TaxID=76891 RepID=UPI0012F49ADA|nr:hypothetical protein [Asticcacaulis biprosthecium]